MENKKITPVEYFLRLLFPQRCLCCDIILPIRKNRPLCTDCRKNLPQFTRCELANPAGDSTEKIYSVFGYEAGIRKAIHYLKFNDRPENASALVDLSYPILMKYFEKKSRPFLPKVHYDIMIPIPIHFRRRQERGYNQSELLARSLSRKTDVPVLTGVLVKRKHTPPQSALTRGERYRNLLGAFEIKKPDPIRGKRILLVDDVMTTGSTLEQCAKILKKAGALQIDAFVVAVRGKLPDSGLVEIPSRKVDK